MSLCQFLPTFDRSDAYEIKTLFCLTLHDQSASEKLTDFVPLFLLRQDFEHGLCILPKQLIKRLIVDLTSLCKRSMNSDPKFSSEMVFQSDSIRNPIFPQFSRFTVWPWVDGPCQTFAIMPLRILRTDLAGKKKLTSYLYFSLTKLPVGLFELWVIDWPHIVKVDYSMPLYAGQRRSYSVPIAEQKWW